MTNITVAQQKLKQYFGYDNFRPMQSEIIQAVLNKSDCLVLMATGGGKSLCFQIPALLMDGVCIVVSPLISLMKDQVAALNLNGIPAAFLNSSLSAADQNQTISKLLSGETKLLYVAPERLVTPEFVNILKQIQINLFAIDEAHCISAWGHNFRPEYTQLQILKQYFPSQPIIALTATADQTTRDDILTQLRIQQIQKFIGSFNRPNIKLTVLPAANRVHDIIDFVRARPNQAGIIYCLSRKETERLAQRLTEAGLNAAHYHAKVEHSLRTQTQEAFINDEIPVICATVAFGMGIDKSNVRYVIHHNLSANIESYYQEIGRAGRDGLPSEAVLFYSSADALQRYRMITQDPELADIQRKVLLKKLEQMKYYAECLSCRRHLLLKYFNEQSTSDCQNCDICLNPVNTFDGSVVSQKMLSALMRIDKPLTSLSLVQIVKGSQAQYLKDLGYDQIKTFGVGKDIDTIAWRQYLRQIIAKDLIKKSRVSLFITAKGKEILYGRQAIQLIKSPFEKVSKRKTARQKRIAYQPTDDYDSDLFEELRTLRKDLADKQNLPAYIVFSDSTLKQMADQKPVTKPDMLAISGVGQKKYETYGEVFMKTIKKYLNHKGE